MNRNSRNMLGSLAISLMALFLYLSSAIEVIQSKIGGVLRKNAEISNLAFDFAFFCYIGRYARLQNYQLF